VAANVVGVDMEPNEDPFRIPTDALAAIGEIAVNAATLETIMVEVILSIKPFSDHENLIKSTQLISRALRQACEGLKHADPALGERTEKWRQRAENCLGDRHSVVHSVFVHDDDTKPATLAHWHPKSDLFKPFNLEAAKRLADNIRICSAAGLHLAGLIVGAFPRGVRGTESDSPS
jgi:hypothetical protein